MIDTQRIRTTDFVDMTSPSRNRRRFDTRRSRPHSGAAIPDSRHRCVLSQAPVRKVKLPRNCKRGPRPEIRGIKEKTPVLVLRPEASRLTAALHRAALSWLLIDWAFIQFMTVAAYL